MSDKRSAQGALTDDLRELARRTSPVRLVNRDTQILHEAADEIERLAAYIEVAEGEARTLYAIIDRILKAAEESSPHEAAYRMREIAMEARNDQ